jgi:hypothetical protein
MDARFRLIHLDGLEVGAWLHTANDPPPGEWAAACNNLADRVGVRDGDFSSLRVFVVSDGGAPNVAQRKELFQVILRGYPVPTAVITTVVATNPVKRGIATALHWLNPQFRVFEPSETRLAIDHIGIARSPFDPIWTVLQSLQGNMPPIKTLGLIATELGLPLEPERRSQFPSSGPPTR